MSKKTLKFISGLSIISFILSPQFANAQSVTAQTDLGTFGTFGAFLSAFFVWGIPITGSLAILMFIYAGFLYMTSKGDQANITSAKDIITGVVLGLVLLFTAEILLRNVIGTLR